MAESTVELIAAKLKEIDSTVDTREGTALRELLIKPLALVLGPLRQEIDQIKKFQSVADSETMPGSELALLAKNFFIERKTGELASTTVRFFIIDAVNTDFEVGAIFTAKNGQEFTNIDAVSFSKSEIELNKEGELFFFDVPVLSLEKAENANIGIDEITSVDIEIPGLTKISNIIAATGGENEETNENLVARIKRSIGLRNLITERGISTVIEDNFSDIFETKIIGFGDDEQHRDTTLGVHVGGRVDIYLKSTEGFTTVEAQFTNADFEAADATGRHIPIDKDSTDKVSIKNTPLIRITKVEIGAIQSDGTFSADKTLVENEDWTLNVKDITGLPANTESKGQHFRFSRKEILDLQIDKEHLAASEDVRVTYEYARFIEPVQDFVDESINRVVASDILVKTFIPTFIDLSLNITILAGKTPADYKTEIEKFINSLASPTVFEASDIIDLAYDLETTDQVDLPIRLVSKTLKPDGTTAIITSLNELDFSSIEDVKVPVTPRIVGTISNIINIVTREKTGL